MNSRFQEKSASAQIFRQVRSVWKILKLHNRRSRGARAFQPHKLQKAVNPRS